MMLKKFNNLVELFIYQYKKQNKNNVFLTSLKGSKKKSYTWQDTYTAINQFSLEISKLINKGDRCMLISENRPEWLISDLAIMMAGGITVPAYTTYIERDYEYLVENCKPKILIISNFEQFKKIKTIVKNKSFIKKVFYFDYSEFIDKNLCTNINDVFNKENFEANILPKFNISRKDPACIIYTSGTQGNPKGVILSHGGILNNCEGAYELLKSFVKKETRFLTWLPLSHSYEHTVQFVQISLSAKVFYAEGIDKLIKNMNECNPEIMTAVPRFYQNLYQKINSTFRKSKGFKKVLINLTVNLGLKKIKKEKLNLKERILDNLATILVRKKIKKQFGGSLKTFVSGGGALDYQVGNFLNAIGLPTLQGYGLTEASPVVSCNPIHDIRVKTVGPPFKGNEVKIAEDGEILVKGENVMLGYWENNYETQKVLKNGWLHTGDIGVFENNYLKITDRKKDIIITPGGDNISPLKIENDLTNSEFVEQAVVYGDSKPFLVALIVPSEEKKNNFSEEFKKELEKINNKLTNIEKIKKIFLINEKFSIENGMLTPTLKLKRYKIIKKYKNEFEKHY